MHVGVTPTMNDMTTDSRLWDRRLREVGREFRRVLAALNIILDVDRRVFETSSELGNLLGEMMKGVCALTKAPFAQILSRQKNELTIVHSTEPNDVGISFPIDDCVSGKAVKDGVPVISGDVQREYPHLYKAVLGGGKTKMRTEVAIPIKSPPPHSVVVGVMNLEWPTKNAFHDDDKDIVMQFARQVGAAIHSARFREALQYTIDLSQLTRAGSPQNAIRQTLDKLAEFFHQEVVVQFLLYEPKTHSLVIEASNAVKTQGIRVLVERSFCGRVVQEKRPLLSNHVRHDYADFFQDTVGHRTGEETQSELAVPIFDREKNVVGILNVESASLDAFAEHDQYLLEVLAGAGLWHSLRGSRRARAIESMAAIGDVAANAVHVLNNAMPPIEKQCEKLAKLAPPGLASEAFLRELKTLQEVLAGVTDRMRMWDEKYKNALEGNVSMDINRVVEEKRSLVTRREVTFQSELDPEMPELKLPPAISDVLWNLLSNANSAVPKGKPGKIIVRTKLVRGDYTHKPEALELDVIDDGIGIPLEKQKTIFDLGEGDRHGYGLWWVKSFVDRCEGTIDVYSKPGDGARFHIWLPLTPDGAARALQDSGGEG
jgi:signal transduction histidine kinase